MCGFCLRTCAGARARRVRLHPPAFASVEFYVNARTAHRTLDKSRYRGTGVPHVYVLLFIAQV